MNAQIELTRYRIYYAKTSSLRYTGNLDIHKIWERALRRANLPLAYTQGFHKQPRINQAAPLPLGFTSRIDMVDIWLELPLAEEDVIQSITPALPGGITVHTVKIIDLRETALQNQVKQAVYHVTLLDPVPNGELSQAVETLLAQSSILRTRRGKEYDLRPLIHQITLLPADESGLTCLAIHLTVLPSATGRPDEVIAALGYDPNLARYERMELLFSE